MRWWDLVGQRTKYPWIRMEPADTKDDWRIELSLACGFVGVFGLIVATGSALFGEGSVAAWALVVAIASFALAHFLRPR
jgi:hypothetical protein